jgi:UDP-2,4-diacetamido-2,4,6-trideoxy-beta-L-altropyranose hydrolase
MKVVLRVDASVAMGTGHVMRCRTLATALQKRGASVHFITRAHPGHLGDMLARDGFAVTMLPQPLTDKEMCRDEYAAWLGVTQQEDADQTIAAMDSQECDWLIVDHDGLDLAWEKRLHVNARKLMVIDDLANRQHDCDVLLDQNYAEDGQERYREWVPAQCHLLLGPRYALLRPEYAKYRETIVRRTGAIKRVLVFMGGADNANITGMVLTAMSTGQLAHLGVDVVIGPNFVHKNGVIAQATARKNTHIHSHRPHLADLMAQADLAIGAGGATTWERMCLGLPSIVMSIAGNQVPACEALASSGLIRYLGNGIHLDVAAVEMAVIEAIAEPEKNRIMGTNNQILVDGKGVNRVAEALDPTLISNLKLRAATANDALTYFSWVNDPEVRSSALNSAPIQWQTHLEWFSKRLKDINSLLFVLEAGDLPVGQVRFERHGDETTIDYSLDVMVRGRGWASHLVRLGIETLNTSQAAMLTATVKPQNAKSAATFLRLGFVEKKIGNAGSGSRHFLLPSAQIGQVGSANGYRQ